MPETESPKTGGQPETASAALFGLCPHCGAKTLFDGVAKFAPRCAACGLDLSRFNVGDGPAAFLTLIIGALITGLAIWLQLSIDPPFWVHAVLWIPLTAISVLWGLRVCKAWLLIAEYKRKASEARSDELVPPADDPA